MEEFQMVHDNGRLIAVVIIEGKTYQKDITEYMVANEALDDWLDYRIFTKYNT